MSLQQIETPPFEEDSELQAAVDDENDDQRTTSDPSSWNELQTTRKNSKGYLVIMRD